MSEINCPECGTLISDNVKKCPKCKFPLGNFTCPEYVADDNIYDMRGKFDVSFGSEVTYSEKRKTALNRKIILFGGTALIAAVVVCAAVMLLVNIITRADKTIDVLDIQTINIGRIMKLNEKYVLMLSSDETRPFVSVIKNKKSNEYSYVYMDNGSGEVDFAGNAALSSEDEPFEPVGYFSGYSVSNDDIESADYESGYYDCTDRTSTVCTVDWRIKLKNNASGILLYDISCENEYRAEPNKYITVIDGIGTGSSVVEGLPYRVRDISFDFKPLYFIPAENLDSSNYSTLLPFSAHFGNFYDGSNVYLSYYIYGDLKMSDIERGVILYDYSLTGFDKSGSTEVKNETADVIDGNCSVVTSGSLIYQDDFTGDRDYSVNIRAYTDWNDISGVNKDNE